MLRMKKNIIHRQSQNTARWLFYENDNTKLALLQHCGKTWVVKHKECGELPNGKRFPLNLKGRNVCKSYAKPAIRYRSDIFYLRRNEIGSLRMVGVLQMVGELQVQGASNGGGSK